MFLHSILFFLAFTASAQSVDAVRVISKSVDRKVTLTGEIQPYDRVTIHGKVTGFIDRVLVDRGSPVREGQLLATVIAPELKAERAQAAARLESAQSEVAVAQAHAASARGTYQRLKAASATEGAISGDEVAQSEQQAAAEESRVKAAVAAMEAEKAALRAVEETEAYLQITAPFSGVITERMASPGVLAGPQIPLFQLEQNSRLRVVVAVPEVNSGRIAFGAKVSFKVSAFPGEVFTGTVARSAHTLDVKTRSMAVELDVRNPHGRLAPGMYPAVDWPLQKGKPVLLVPPTSIVTTTEKTFVNCIRDGVVSWVPVSRGAASGDLVEVSGALSDGEIVARRGTDELREGTRVTVKFKTL